MPRPRRADGYYGVQLGFGPKDEKHSSKAERGHCAKAGASAMSFVRELRFDAMPPFKQGDEVGVDTLKDVTHVDITGLTKGLGHTGLEVVEELRLLLLPHHQAAQKVRQAFKACQHVAGARAHVLELLADLSQALDLGTMDPRDLLEEVGFDRADAYFEGWDDEAEDTDGMLKKRKRYEEMDAWVGYLAARKPE